MPATGNDVMIDFWGTIIWQQFGAAIDMLENAMLACPDELWGDRTQPSEFGDIVYHTLFWLDLYLSGSVEGFTPPTPFTLDELEPVGLLPEWSYTKDELHGYLRFCRRKCQTILEELTEAQAARRCQFGWGEISFAELLLYNMRHVQDHAAQLSLILGQKTGSGPGWVARAKTVSKTE